MELSKDRATIDDVLNFLGVNRESVLVSVNGEITVEEECLSKGDEIRLIRAVSGG